nr:hypothetical protein BgiMline_031899 [Biomphalaria glabrata]
MILYEVNTHRNLVHPSLNDFVNRAWSRYAEGGTEFYTSTRLDNFTYILKSVSKYENLNNLVGYPDIEINGNYK